MSFNKLILPSSSDNHDIPIFNWQSPKSKANVLIIHGMGEHALRYNDFSEFLSKNDLNIYAFHQREHGGDNKKSTWQLRVNDVIDIYNLISKNNLPTIALGHSMGSFVLRSTLPTKKINPEGIILSGTASHPGFLGHIGKFIIRLNSFINGKENTSKFIHNLVFKSYNRKIKNPKTVYDWLSKDENVVQEYINDQHCGQIFTNRFYYELLDSLITINQEKNINLLNKNTPYLFVYGDADPVGYYGKGPRKIIKTYKTLGFSNITKKEYHDGRHEMINEVNKVEVYKDILNWIQDIIEKK